MSEGCETVRAWDTCSAMRPTAARLLKALRAGGPQTTDQLTNGLAEHGRAIRPATIQVALGELVAAELVASTGEDGQQQWRASPTARDPLLEAVDLRGATTSATPSRPGWRTPASRPGSSMR